MKTVGIILSVVVLCIESKSEYQQIDIEGKEVKWD